MIIFNSTCFPREVGLFVFCVRLKMMNGNICHVASSRQLFYDSIPPCECSQLFEVYSGNCVLSVFYLCFFSFCALSVLNEFCLCV